MILGCVHSVVFFLSLSEAARCRMKGGWGLGKVFWQKAAESPWVGLSC